MLIVYNMQSLLFGLQLNTTTCTLEKGGCLKFEFLVFYNQKSCNTRLGQYPGSAFSTTTNFYFKDPYSALCAHYMYVVQCLYVYVNM